MTLLTQDYMKRLTFPGGSTDDRSYRTYWPYMFTLDGSAAGGKINQTEVGGFQAYQLKPKANEPSRYLL